MPTAKPKPPSAICNQLWCIARSFVPILSLVLLLCGCQLLQPAKTSITVEWTTESEVDVAGFNLYRSENPDGPYTQINATLIPGSNDPVTGGKYHYVDSNVEPGRTYYYKLEDVDLSGTKTTHGPIEVQAEGGGWLDSPLVLVILVGLGGTGIVWWYLRYRR
jgi:hypothetical protein